MTDEVEKYSRRRRRLLIGMAIAFIIWQLAGLEMINDFAGGDRRVFLLVGLLAFVFWAGVLVWIMVAKGMRGASLAAQTALNDELVRANRMKAFSTGYWTMLIVSGLALAVSVFIDVRANEVAQIILVSGVVAPMFAFARLEGQGD